MLQTLVYIQKKRNSFCNTKTVKTYKKPINRGSNVSYKCNTVVLVRVKMNFFISQWYFLQGPHPSLSLSHKGTILRSHVWGCSSELARVNSDLLPCLQIPKTQKATARVGSSAHSRRCGEVQKQKTTLRIMANPNSHRLKRALEELPHEQKVNNGGPKSEPRRARSATASCGELRRVNR